MIGYVMVGLNNKEKVVFFYDVFMEVMGYQCFFEVMYIIVWGWVLDQIKFMVCIFVNGKEVIVGNGLMIVFEVFFKEDVDCLYSKVFELGVKNFGDLGD